MGLQRFLDQGDGTTRSQGQRGLGQDQSDDGVTGGYQGPRLPGSSVLLGPSSIGPRGRTKPKKPVLGTELAGVVEDIGKDVQNFKVGDQVFALTGHDLGCYAEYRCVPEGGIISRKPVNLSFEEAAAIPMGGLTALHFLREGNVGRGTEGTGLWRIGEHRNLRCAVGQALRCGGDRGVQHRQPGPGTVAGSRQGHRLHQGGLLQGGRHIRCGARCCWQEPPLSQYEVVEEGWLLFSGARPARSEPAHALGDDDHGHRMVGGTMAPGAKDLAFLKDLAEGGKIKPVIDRTYPMEQIVEAHRYVDKGHKKGNVVIKV